MSTASAAAIAESALPPLVKPVPQPLLEIVNLKTWFFTRDGIVRAVDGVSFYVLPRRDAGGGRRKRLRQERYLALDIAADRVAARTHRRGRGPLRRTRSARLSATPRCAKIRGNDISMIFQEPMTSLNPVLTIGRQIAETLTLHRGSTARRRRARAIEMLRLVRIPEAERRVQQYPHELSGGMRQRVMIAMALACDPQAADRRRADHRARRDDPGADPRPDARAARARPARRSC